MALTKISPRHYQQSYRYNGIDENEIGKTQNFGHSIFTTSNGEIALVKHGRQQSHEHLLFHSKLAKHKMVLPTSNVDADKLILRTLNTTTKLLNSYDKKVRWAAELVDVHTYKVPKDSGWCILRRKLKNAVEALRQDIDL